MVLKSPTFSTSTNLLDKNKFMLDDTITGHSVKSFYKSPVPHQSPFGGSNCNFAASPGTTLNLDVKNFPATKEKKDLE